MKIFSDGRRGDSSMYILPNPSNLITEVFFPIVLISDHTKDAFSFF